MSNNKELPSEEELSKLSKSSITVYAIRCALRVQPFLASWSEPNMEYKKAVVSLNHQYHILVYAVGAYTGNNACDNARAAILAYGVREVTVQNSDTVNVNDALHAVYAAIAVAAYDIDTRDTVCRAASAVNYGCYACYIMREVARDAAITDYEQLKILEIEVTDASDTGPLGDLWHGSPPDWYTEAKEHYDKTIVEWEQEI